ncbi:MAG: hypothetical protein KJ072_10420, partial [Verrucomicrobia bacterium]|nr:hypothetical protein [Verrucomicrobiota bacterium]
HLSFNERHQASLGAPEGNGGPAQEPAGFFVPFVSLCEQSDMMAFMVRSGACACLTDVDGQSDAFPRVDSSV